MVSAILAPRGNSGFPVQLVDTTGPALEGVHIMDTHYDGTGGLSHGSVAVWAVEYIDI
jgi:hypothetical protein